MQVVVITGLSGAGKSQAMACLEDIGFYCIDNIPPALMQTFVNLTAASDTGIEKIAFVVDVRGGELFGGLRDAIADLKATDLDVKVLFLEATDATLIKRFNETRRVHPLTRMPAKAEDIAKERKTLADIRKEANFIIDTSNMKTAALKEYLIEILTDEQREETFVINVMSFGFKHGIPINADMVFDMRFIPNPYYVPGLKKLTGNNKKIRQYVMKYQETQTFIKNLDKLINNIIPCYMREGKWSLTVAFGCTGGHHRSVAMANEFYEKFKLQGKQVTLDHRDIKK